MRIGLGFFTGLVTGAIWGFVAMVIIGVTLAMAAGIPAIPAVSSATLAGLVAAAILMAFPGHARTSGVQMAVAGAFLIVLMLVSFAQPFGVPLNMAPAWQGVALILLTGAVFWAIRTCIQDTQSGPLTRYEFETVLVRVLQGLGFVIFTVMVALPFYVMIITSLKNQASLMANPLDFSISLENGISGLFISYYELFTTFNFGRYMLISAFVSTATVVITLLFSVPGAYAVARLRFPGRAFLARSVLLIYMVPAIVLVIPLYSVFSQLALRDSLIGLLIVYPATTIPVALYMLQGYFRGLPGELEEAGLMDGCTRFGVIMRITLPLSLPALASVALYVFMIAWNEFLFAFMFLDDPNIFTLSRGVVSLNSSEVPRQHLMAGAVVATIPILFIFLWFERFLVQGLTAGSVKG
ncbi:MAG: carbohydrate ABC transporter permease [Pseudomonadota bacterium]